MFWSFGCEASLLAVSRLQDELERWPDDVTVLAVHTPRFPHEEDRARVVAALERHRVDLPVLHDPDYLTWNRYNPEGWPATAVIDRRGRVVGMVAGIDIEPAVEAVATELARAERRSRGPAVTVTGPASRTGVEPDSTLRFPSAVATTHSGMTVVADSGNDRLLVGRLDPDLRTLRPEIEITDVVNPIAVAAGSESIVYVIERGTGSILQVDLGQGAVDLLADEELDRPTAILVDRDGSLVVADAGRDVLVRIGGGSEDEVIIGPIAGSGVTGCRDGAADDAELAQPVALARVPAGIAFCDAASSNVRLLTDAGRVVTVTGSGFYDWGLIDGPAHRARLQRPGGAAAMADGSIVIADTGNDRLRVLRDRQLETLGLAGLDQPTGIAALDSGHLLIADTGNHRLVVADPVGRTGWPLAVYPPTMTSVWQETATGGDRRPG